MSRPYRLFHFDLATEANFGDTLLFPAVKHVFEAYGAGDAFEIYDSTPLRENVGPALVRNINENADAVLIGGGGLFLADTNANKESGWQWRISLDVLEQLKVPIIVFAVGYNRFYAQPDFEPPFAEHVTRTLEKSIFFGLRNSGSIEKVSSYVPENLVDKIGYQPCPTTIARSMLPDSYTQPDEKRIGVQLSHSTRHAAAGYTRDCVLEAADQVFSRLEDAGWDITLTPYTQEDEKFTSRLEYRFRRYDLVRFYGKGMTERGLSTLRRTPVVLGCRGHAQMVPFGMGALPFSFDLHPKLGFFHDDIGRSDWNKNPLESDFADSMMETIEAAWLNRDENQNHLAEKQKEFLGITQSNLAEIYTKLGGNPSELRTEWKIYDKQASNIANGRFLLQLLRESSIRRANALVADKARLQESLAAAERNNMTASSDRAILEAELLREKRRADSLVERNRQLQNQNSSFRSIMDTSAGSNSNLKINDGAFATARKVVKKMARRGKSGS